MYNQLINFIYKNKILYKYQFGCRKLHSTNHTIISLVEKVNNRFWKDFDRCVFGPQKSV